MNEILFNFAESAVLLSNILLSFAISILVSFIVGLFIGTIRSSIKNGIITTVLFEIILIIMFFAVRDKVQKERLKKISATMSTIELPSSPCIEEKVQISNWKEGLKYIKRCPTEIGYYIVTADFLEDDKDYESAATLLEMGLDFLRQDPPSSPLCERLKRYYQKLDDRPKLDDKCGKYHEL